MNWLKRFFFALGVIALSSNLASAAALDGNWDGAIALNAGMKLRLVLHVETTNGTMGGTLRSIDQGGALMQLSTVKLDGTAVSFALTQPAASFQGTLSADGQSIAGTWSQNGGALPLTFARRAPGAADPVISRPQEPHPPYPYKTEDVVYDGAGGIRLAGTLTLPATGGPFATAILIQGSGPHDRDETLFGHKPFLVLADYLTRHGIAVLRSDKRGIGQSTGNYATATSEDFAADTESAIAYLKTRPEIDPRRIGLIGHSEGGLIAPMVAAKDHSIAFIVLMAGPGLRGDVILEAQGRLIAEAMGASAQTVADTGVRQAKIFAAVASGGSDEDRRTKVRAIMAETYPALSATDLDARVAPLVSPWFRFFLSYDPVPTLKQMRCPVLAINGEKDLQVPPKADLAAIKKALSGNPDVETIEFPGLNHLFQTAKAGAPSEYADISETIAPTVLDTITSWIVTHATKMR